MGLFDQAKDFAMNGGVAGAALGIGAKALGLGGKGGGGGGGPSMPRPTMPLFNSLRDAKTGMLSNPNYNLKAGPDVLLDKRGLNAVRDRALATGPSAWAGLAAKNQALEEAKARDRAGANAAAGSAQARAALASKRGLSGGAAERLAGTSARDLMMSRQGVGQAGQTARAQIGLQDEQQKMDLLKQLPGMEVQALDPEFKNRQMNVDTSKYNIDQALKDKYTEDQAKQNEYQEQMKAWAANEQANSIMRAGGGKK
jgi:hypothetical protein